MSSATRQNQLVSLTPCSPPSNADLHNKVTDVHLPVVNVTDTNTKVTRLRCNRKPLRLRPHQLRRHPLPQTLLWSKETHLHLPQRSLSHPHYLNHDSIQLSKAVSRNVEPSTASRTAPYQPLPEDPSQSSGQVLCCRQLSPNQS